MKEQLLLNEKGIRTTYQNYDWQSQHVHLFLGLQKQELFLPHQLQ
jgi:hypothetical protein